MKCNKCNGRIITSSGEHPQCIVCGWVNYDELPVFNVIKAPPEFSTGRVVLPSIPTSEKIKSKDIVVYLSSNIPYKDMKQGSVIQYVPICPYCNRAMMKRSLKSIGSKPVKPTKDLRIRVILYRCKKNHLIHLHDCPAKGLLYWTPSGERNVRKKSKNRSASPSREGSIA